MLLKYKKRKLEAIKKLDRTHANMTRVNDILRELEMNILPLEKQSRDAKKYLEKKQELTDLEVSLMVSDIGTYNHQTKELQAKIDSLKDELVTLSSNHSSYDVDLLTKKDKVKTIEEEINKNQNTLIELTKSIEKIDADIRVLKERKKYTEDNQEEMSLELLKRKEEVMQLELSFNEVKNELDKYQEQLKMDKEKEREQSRRIQEWLKKKNQLLEHLEQSNRDKVDLNYKIKYLENSIQQDNSLPSSVKNILNHTRFRGVHNVIGKLIKMEDVYHIAISVALGGAANY